MYLFHKETEMKVEYTNKTILDACVCACVRVCVCVCVPCVCKTFGIDYICASGRDLVLCAYVKKSAGYGCIHGWRGYGVGRE